MRILSMFFALIAAPLFAQEPALPLPLIYHVTGLVAGDALNIRQEPNADAFDLGGLMPGQQVEVIQLSADGKWGQVATNAGFGWVSTHFLTLAVQNVGDGVTAPSGMPLWLSCTGSEPFWEATIEVGKRFSFTDYGWEEPQTQVYPMLGVAKPINISMTYYGFSSPPFTGVLSRELCDTGMSGYTYGWQLNLVARNSGDKVNMYYGCCTALQSDG